MACMFGRSQPNVRIKEFPFRAQHVPNGLARTGPVATESAAYTSTTVDRPDAPRSIPGGSAQSPVPA